MITSAAMAVVFALVGGAAAVGYWNLQRNIRSADLLQPGQTHPAEPAANPELANANVNDGPVNILVLGTDTRAGVDGSFGSVTDSGGYGNSDVIIIVHISADRKSADVVSIPRDTMAPYPGCVDPQTGTVTPPAAAQIINSALKLGGPSCTVKTIEAVTGISIDHFMVADFNAVVDLTNTLGGVQVCVDAPIVDPLSTLNLPKGNSLIQGQQALAFLRTRHGFGDGSDLGRIKAQQGFLASMVRKIKSDGTLTDVPKLYSIADTVTKNLTVDNDLASIPALLDMANRLRGIDPQNVTFVTAPNEPYVLDPNRVQLQDQTAQLLFRAIAADEDVTKALSPAAPVAPAPVGEAAPSAAVSPGATAAPTATATVTEAALPADVTGQNGADATCQSAYAG
ncbi:MAG: LCP family protein [Actinomycetota bacterium]|nr:LCP family protein [Actinomycetota bacterium]